jgi:hypothetical protein
VYGNAAIVGSGVMFYQTVDMTIEADYVQPGGVHDWGNEAVDGTAVGAGAVTSSGNAFITFDGDGTNAILVRISSDVLLDSSPPLDDYGGEANARNEYGLTAVMTGLVPGQPSAVLYSWSVVAAAGFPSAGVGAVGAVAEGTLDALIFNASSDSIFAESVTGVAGQPPLQLMSSGAGVLPFTPAATTLDFVVSAKSVAAAIFSGPPDFDDLVGATFYAEARFTLVQVPEPRAMILLATVLPLAVGARRTA